MFWKITVLPEANSGHILHDHCKPAKVHHSLMESHDVWMPLQQLHRSASDSLSSAAFIATRSPVSQCVAFVMGRLLQFFQ